MGVSCYNQIIAIFYKSSVEKGWNSFWTKWDVFFLAINIEKLCHFHTRCPIGNTTFKIIESMLISEGQSPADDIKVWLVFTRDKNKLQNKQC